MKETDLNNRIRAEIDLDAIDYNVETIHSHLAGNARIAAVIKADGYGHGAAPIARLLQLKPYVWGFCVAAVQEAYELRHSGIVKPIMLLGYAFPEDFELIVSQSIRACIFDEETARLLSEEAVRYGRDAIIHFAVDSGMSRIGFSINDDQRVASIETIERIIRLPRIKVEGIFTHFARADEEDKAPALAQLVPFLSFVKELRDRGIDPGLVHASNSSASLRIPEAHLDMVRAGIALYGMSPSDIVTSEGYSLKRALSLISHISYVKTLPEGTAISYGGTYVTSRTARVATVPIGYADGYPRMLSNKGAVLIHGRRAPILGRVCMDQFMVDVTDIPDVVRGDEVVLIGTQGEETITPEELGALSDRFNYELVSCINKRVPRFFRRGGEIIAQVDYFALR